MATGQKTLKTRDVKVTKFERRVAPAGEYEVKLLAEKAQLKVGQGPDSRPRVPVMFELLGTESETSGKTIKIFHDFFTSLKPGKDGKTMVERSHGAIAFARGMGEELEDANIPIVDLNGVDCVSPKHLLQWLKNRDGAVVKARIKVEKGQDGSPQNRVDYFIEGEAVEATEETEVDDDYSLSTDAEEDAELVEEEDLPPTPVKKGGKKK